MTDQQQQAQQQQQGGEQQQQSQTPPAFDWTKHGFEGEDLGYIQNKAFADPKAAITAYRNLEGMLGADKATLLRIPKEQTPEALRGIYAQLGMPEKPEGYKLPVPEGDDGALANVARGWFHEAGLTAKQAEIVVTKLNEHVAGVTGAQTEATKAKAAEALTALKGEWGAAWQQNVDLVDKAAEVFGMSAEDLVALRDAMGPANAMKFMHRIGSKLGAEDSLPNDGIQKGAMSPQQALNQLTALKNDPEWSKKFLAGDAAALAESERLHKFAYGAG